jgi:hypothetical protein
MRGIVGEERRGKETDGCPLTVFICFCGCLSVCLVAHCMHLASAHFSASKASACDPIPSSF